MAALEHSDAVEDRTTVDLAEALDATPRRPEPVGRVSRSTNRSILEWIHAAKTASPHSAFSPAQAFSPSNSSHRRRLRRLGGAASRSLRMSCAGTLWAGRRTGAEEVGRVRREPGHDRDRLVIQRIADWGTSDGSCDARQEEQVFALSRIE